MSAPAAATAPATAPLSPAVAWLEAEFSKEFRGSWALAAVGLRCCRDMFELVPQEDSGDLARWPVPLGWHDLDAWDLFDADDCDCGGECACDDCRENCG